MKVQCVLCDKIEEKDPNALIGKKLRNRPAATYMCNPCSQRIKINTEKRRMEGRLKTPTFHKEKDEW